MSVSFNMQKFSADVKAARGKKTQSVFAKELGLGNHTLISLYEDGKKAPSKEVFANFCNITGNSADEYWIKSEDVPSVYLMGAIGEKDKPVIKDVLDKVGVYEYLFAQFKRIKK